MTRAGIFVACALSMAAQQPGDKPADAQTSPPASQPAAKVDPQVHADAVKLVEVNGMKERLEGNIKSIIEGGRARIMSASPNCNGAFGDEWVKRMQARLGPESFVRIAVNALETHISDADLKQLIAFQEGAKANPQNPPVLAPEFKQRISGAMSAVQTEILSGGLNNASKLALKVSNQVKKDHPEYCPGAPEKPKGE